MRSYLRATVAVLFLIAAGSETLTFGFQQEEAMIHGFAGQGYIKSSDNNYLGDSKDGSYEYNEIGVNFLLPATDDLRLGIQVFSRDLGKYGNNEVTVDWALLDYYWKSWLGFRAGKVKMPYGLYNRSRDVDNLRTSAILNQGVYMEGIRDLVIAIYGFNLYGSKTMGGLGEITYDLFGGTLDLPGDSPFIQDFFARMQYGNPLLGALAANIDVSQLEIQVKHFEGGQLLWNTPAPGLTLSVTDLMGKMGMDIAGITGDVDLSEFSVLSARYDIGEVSLILERMKADIAFNMMGIDLPTEFEGWYGELAWRMVDWLHLGASYGEYYPDSDDKKGDNIENGGLPDYYAWQKDTTLSTKFNINEYFCIKFEAHFIDGLGLTDISDYSPGDVKKHWNLYVIKTSINL